MKKKKSNGESKGGAPLWMVTYGDMMSLLLCFFVLLVSMSSIQESKFKKAMGSLMGALGVMKLDRAIIEFEELPIPAKYRFGAEDVQRELQRFKEYLEKVELEDNVEVEETDEGFVLRLDSPILFATGQADLKFEAIEVLGKVSDMIKDIDSDIVVEGHTDNIPIRTGRFPSNWELSAARAIRVIRFFKQSGIRGEELTAVGRGEYRPIVDNDTPENRAKNRRVEIYVNYKDRMKKEAYRNLFNDNR